MGVTIMSGMTSSPTESIVIDDPETMKVIADPLRLRLLEALARPRTVKELAAAVDRKPDRLYYHLRKLVDVGLVHEVDSRMVGSVVERVWQVRYRKIAVNAAAATPALAGPLVDDALARITKGMAEAEHHPDDGAPRAILAMEVVRVSPEARAELAKRLSDLVREVAAEHPSDDEGDGDLVAFHTGLFVIPHAEDDE